MKPVRVSVDVPNPRPEVYEFLDVLGNHEQFTDHFMVDWELSGPKRGVGAKANVRVKATGEKDRTEMEVVEADAGRRIVEEGKGGSRGSAPNARQLHARRSARWRHPHRLHP